MRTASQEAHDVQAEHTKLDVKVRMYICVSGCVHRGGGGGELALPASF